MHAYLSPALASRLFRVGLFVGLVVLFRHLAVLLVFFVAFERGFGFVADRLAPYRVPRKATIAALALGVLGLVAGAGALGLGRLLRERRALQEALTGRIEEFRATPLYRQLEEWIAGTDSVVERAQHYAGEALHYASAAGHALVYVLLAFLLAVIYLLEREELEELARRLEPRSLLGTLHRWLGHLADAISVTLQFQVVVAACNAVLTLPILWLIGIPHKVAFLFMIFFSGMVPVVGNFVAGAILTLVAYQARGIVGAVLFSVLTFVLHKVESYYLNPRLARRHVHLPGFVLVVSLLLWETLLGFVGLFVSFPFLFVAMRLRDEFRAEDAPARPVVDAAERRAG